MWIFTKTGFISVVQKPHDKTTLTVRARVQGDIESIFPDAKVQAGGGTDYAYRATIDRAEVARVMHDQIMGLDYSNFKGVIRSDPHHDACMRVWSVMHRHQQDMLSKERAAPGRMSGKLL